MDRVALENVDAEFALVGSLLAWPKTMLMIGDTISAEWFTDDSARVFFDAALKVHQAGGEISREAVIGHLPDLANDHDPLLVQKLYIALIDKAVAPEAIPGVLHIVRDRWARRVLSSTSEFVGRVARDAANDPFDLSSEMIAQVERIQSTRKVKDAGYLDQGGNNLIIELKSKRAVRSFTTGLKSLDKKIGRYRAGQLYVIAARPAMGKSTFALSSLIAASREQHGVAFISLEMTEEEVWARCVSDLGDHAFTPTYSQIMKRQLSDTQIEELETINNSLQGLPLYVDYSPNLSLRDIKARAREVQLQMESDGRRLDILCVDHLTIIAPGDRYRGNPVMEVSANIDGLRVLAKELDIAVVVLCQLSRDVEKRDDKRPTLSDLRWTGEIEQAAHVVAFLYRENYYLANDPDADHHRLTETHFDMDFLVRKNRQGETGDVTLWADMAHSRVRDAK
jgi:replicative DNA helicase